MHRLPLDPSTLQVESFSAVTVEVQPNLAAQATYPDCPTATGCTCVEACQSIVRACVPTVLEPTAV